MAESSDQRDGSRSGSARLSMRQSAEVLLKRLEWTVIRRLDGLLQGDYRTLWRGAGLDLADLREYQHHDDVRHIDWNVTARLQQPYVRQFTEDRELTAWFLVDLSASVDFGSNDVSAHAPRQPGGRLAVRHWRGHGDPVGQRTCACVEHAATNVQPPR